MNHCYLGKRYFSRVYIFPLVGAMCLINIILMNVLYAADSANPTCTNASNHLDHTTEQNCKGEVVVKIVVDYSGEEPKASASLKTINNKEVGYTVKRCPGTVDGESCSAYVKDTDHVFKSNSDIISQLSSKKFNPGSSGSPTFSISKVNVCDKSCELDVSVSDDSEYCPCTTCQIDILSHWNILTGKLMQNIPLQRNINAHGLNNLNLVQQSTRYIPKEANVIGGSWWLSISEFLYDEDETTIAYTKGDGETILFDKATENTYYSMPSKTYCLSIVNNIPIVKDKYGIEKIFEPFTYSPNSRTKYSQISEIKSKGKPSVYFAYDKGRLNKISYGSKNSEIYQLTYNNENRLTEINDKYGNRITTFIYNTEDQLAKLYYGDNRLTSNPHYSFVYGSSDKILEKTRPNGGVVKYEYDKSGQLIKGIDANGSEFSVKRNGDKVTVTDRNGQITKFVVYSGYGKFKEARYPDGKYIKQSLNVSGQITEKSGDCRSCDGGAELVKHIFNEKGLVTSIEYFDKSTLISDEKFKYDDNNNKISYIDRNGNETTYKYDKHNNLIETIKPDGSSEKTEYDNKGNVISQIDPLGNRTLYKYDKIGNLTEQVNPDGGVWKYGYDQFGRKTMEWSPGGNLTSLRYNTLGYLVEKVGPIDDRNKDNTVDHKDLEIARISGNFETWTRDTEGNPLTHTDRNGNTTRFEYDGQWKLIKTIFPDNSFEQYFRDGEGRIIKTLHRDGNYTFTKYDPMGKVIEKIWDNGAQKGVIDSSDAKIVNKYSNDGYLIATLDRNGNMTSYEYDTFGRRIKTTDPLGNVTQIKYKGDNVVARIDALGRATKYEYDKRNRMIALIAPDGSKTKYEYDPNGNRTKVFMPNGTITLNKYDNMNRLVESVADAEGQQIITAYVYDKGGRRIESVRDKGGLNLTIRYKYDDKGRNIETIAPDGIVVRNIYDNMGNMIERIIEKDDIKQITTISYDMMNRPAKIISPDDKITRVHYDESGQRFTVSVDPDGLNIKTRYDYNFLGIVTKTVNDMDGNEENTTLNKYDSQGNLIAAVDGSGIKTLYKYNEDNRRIQTLNSLGFTTETKYDKDGRVIAMVDQNGRSKMTSYNKLGQVVEQLNEMNQPVAYTYSKAGNRLTLKDASNNVSVWTYDTLNRPISLKYPNGDKEMYRYDRLGRMIEKTKPDGAKIKYEYDKGDRIAKITTPQGVLVFLYDALGRKIEEIDNTLPNGEVGKVTYKYNAAGKLVEKTDYNINQTIRYTYNTLGQKTSMSVGATVVNYRYNRRGLLSEVQRHDEKVPTSYSYDKAGRRIKLSLSNGVVTKYTYDKAGRLTAVISTNKEGKVISGTEYKLGKTGNRTAMRLTLNDQVQLIGYEFDEAYRLTNETRKDEKGNLLYQDSFTYDALGNRLNRVRMQDGNTAITTTYTYNDANQLLTETSEGITKTYSYDQNGNTIEIKSVSASGKEVGNVTMTYDWLNRQTSRSDGKNSVKQIYRGNEWKRIATIVEDNASTDKAKTTTVKYLYDGDNVVADYSADNKQVALYVTPMLDQYISKTTISDKGEAAIHYYTQDGLGSVRSLTDIEGKSVNLNDYFAFGEINEKATRTAIDNRYTYSGREAELASSTVTPMYYRWRIYEYTLGRFEKRDPLYYAPNIFGSLYSYVGNSPVYHKDSYGQAITESQCNSNMSAAKRTNAKIKNLITEITGFAAITPNPPCNQPNYACNCCTGSNSKSSGYTNGTDVVLCYNNIGSATELFEVLAHELTHYRDFCKGLITDCETHACSEIRAYDAEGGCVQGGSLNPEVSPGTYKYSGTGWYRKCIAAAAKSSTRAGSYCTTTAEADAAVDSQLNSCMNP